MKKYVFIFLVVAVAVYLTGCGRKKDTLEEAQEPLSIEVSPTATTFTQQAPAAPAAVTAKSQQTAEVPLPPQSPYKPTNQQIQAALKNAGYYTGQIDGKIGPLTKKAIEEFQKANNLKADGKVGLKTWALLSAHLNPQAAEEGKR